MTFHSLHLVFVYFRLSLVVSIVFGERTSVYTTGGWLFDYVKPLIKALHYRRTEVVCLSKHRASATIALHNMYFCPRSVQCGLWDVRISFVRFRDKANVWIKFHSQLHPSDCIIYLKKCIFII